MGVFSKAQLLTEKPHFYFKEECAEVLVREILMMWLSALKPDDARELPANCEKTKSGKSVSSVQMGLLRRHLRSSAFLKSDSEGKPQGWKRLLLFLFLFFFFFSPATASRTEGI